MTENNEKYVYAYEGEGGTIYNTQNPKVCYLWTGGSETWRNNNPGKVVLSRFILRCGAIGMADDIAVFPDFETGDKAHQDFLRNVCFNFTVQDILSQNLPEDESDAKRYIEDVCKDMNVSSDTVISDLPTQEFQELVQIIHKNNWAIGKIKKIANPRYVWRTMKDERVRDTHQRREGGAFFWSHPPKDGHPGELFNCRCIALPYYPILKKNGTIEGVCAEILILYDILGIAKPDKKNLQPDSSFTDDDLVNESFELIKDKNNGEGLIDHVYFDTKGNLTTGYGTKINTKEEYCARNWKVKGHSLTKAQKEVNYDKIMELKKGYNFNTIAQNQEEMKVFGRIDEAEATFLAHRHLKSVSLPEIRTSFKNKKMDFDSLPPSTQVAMVDIHYNSGGITDEKWPNMLDALRINNFDWAAKESRRGDVQALRNAEAARLILQGKKELKHKREKGTWR